MRYLELLLTDVADHPDAPARREWIHRDHIETIEHYLHTEPGRPAVLWLELGLTSGRTRYIPLGPVDPEHADEAARTAITALLEDGTDPVRAATLGTRAPGKGRAAATGAR